MDTGDSEEADFQEIWWNAEQVYQPVATEARNEESRKRGRKCNVREPGCSEHRQEPA